MPPDEVKSMMRDSLEKSIGKHITSDSLRNSAKIDAEAEKEQWLHSLSAEDLYTMSYDDLSKNIDFCYKRIEIIKQGRMRYSSDDPLYRVRTNRIEGFEKIVDKLQKEVNSPRIQNEIYKIQDEINKRNSQLDAMVKVADLAYATKRKRFRIRVLIGGLIGMIGGLMLWHFSIAEMVDSVYGLIIILWVFTGIGLSIFQFVVKFKSDWRIGYAGFAIIVGFFKLIALPFIGVFIGLYELLTADSASDWRP